MTFYFPGGLGLSATKFARLAEVTALDAAIGVTLAAHNSIGLKVQGPVHICNLLGLNYCENYCLNNGLYCAKRVHSHLLFGQLLPILKSLIIGSVPIFEKFTQ